MVGGLISLQRHAFASINGVVSPYVKCGAGTPPPIGVGAVVVSATGRTSGLPREVPLAGARVGDTVVVSTVRDGSQWIRNLERDPAAVVWVEGTPRAARASVRRLPGFSVAVLRLGEESVAVPSGVDR